MTAGALTRGSAGLWERPLGGVQAACLVGGLAATGFALEVATQGRGLAAAVWPASGLLLGAWGLITLGACLAARGSAVMRWLGGIPMTLAVFGAIGLLALVAGVVPGEASAFPAWARQLGLHQAVRGWPFALLFLLLLLNLGIATLRRPARAAGWRAAAAPLCHAGLWVALAAGFFGAGDLQRVRVAVRERDVAVSTAQNAAGRPLELPFSVALLDFRMEEYPALLAVRQGTEPEPADTLEARTGERRALRGHVVEVIEALPHAREDGAGFVASPDPGDAPAARVRVDGFEPAWITCGGPVSSARMIPLADDTMLVMMAPRPKRFASEVILRDHRGAERGAVIEVNRPQAVSGWRLYQLSYDESRGAGSEWSVLEAVRDPWYPVVKGGLCLVLAGAGVLLVSGRGHGQGGA
jgi:hypothetical protein